MCPAESLSKLLAQISSKFPLVILLLICCFLHLFGYVYSPKWVGKVNENYKYHNTAWYAVLVVQRSYEFTFRNSLCLSHTLRHSPYFKYKEFTTLWSQVHISDTEVHFLYYLQQSISNNTLQYYYINKQINRSK